MEIDEQGHYVRTFEVGMPKQGERDKEKIERETRGPVTSLSMLQGQYHSRCAHIKEVRTVSYACLRHNIKLLLGKV